MKKLLLCLFLFLILFSCKTDRNKPGDRKEFTVNGVKFAVRYIPSGEFMMGSRETENGRSPDETLHKVNLDRSFWMMETEVTQELYTAVMGSNPSHFKDSQRPVERVTWNNAMEFCKKLSEITGRTWELPTEAEWEYACRAGTDGPFHYGDILTFELANFNGSFPYGDVPAGKNRGETVPVMSFKPNNWGLYDMHGNVNEWCADWYHDYLEAGQGQEGSQTRIARGGSWFNHAKDLRSAKRVSYVPDYRSHTVGFRAVLR